MKKFFVSLCMALGIFFISKTDCFALEPTIPILNDGTYTLKFSTSGYFVRDLGYGTNAYAFVTSNGNSFVSTYYSNATGQPTYIPGVPTLETNYPLRYLGNGLYVYPKTISVNSLQSLTMYVPVYESIDDIVLPPSKSDVIDSFGGDGFNINGSLNGNTVDVFKCNPFRLLSTDYMYYEVSIKSLKQFSGSKAIIKLIGDRSTYSHTVTNPFLTSFDTIPVDDYVSVNSNFYMVCTPIDADGNYGNSIVYKYRLTQDGVISVYDVPIDTPKRLNVDINNNYLPVTQINKNRAFVTNIDYSTVTYNSMNVEYSNTWDIYYSPNISTSNDNISIQNITDSYNTYNYVTNNYNDLTYGLGLNFDFGDNDISDDGNVIDTLDDIKLLLSFLPWLLGLFTFIPGSFVTIILGGFAIILVVVIVKIFK